jgi:RHS repeat-associated protein
LIDSITSSWTDRATGTPTQETLSYTYDANGNTTAKGNRTFEYNQNNRLVKVTEDSTVLGEYLYNGVGQRVKKTADGITTYFIYDFLDNIIAESDGTGTIHTEYLYRGRGRLAKADISETGSVSLYFYMNDRLGTPEAMLDENQQVVWEAVYQPFGEAAVHPGSSVVNNMRFPGQYYDSETGLHYNYFRYYDPSVGRYLTPDPIGLAGGINLYAYVSGNPVNWVDPLGLLTESYNNATGGGWKAPPQRYNPTHNVFNSKGPSWGVVNPSDLKAGADSSTGPLAFYGSGAALIIVGTDLTKSGLVIIAAGGPVGWVGGTVVTGTGVIITSTGIWTFYQGTQIEQPQEGNVNCDKK